VARLPGKRKFKRTTFGKRALEGARSGTGGIQNPDGSRSSVRTATYDIPGKRGRTDVMLAPTIRKDPKTGKLRQLSHSEAVAAARSSGDFIRIKGGKTEKKIEKARKKGDKKSRKFSRKLGKISTRRGR
jgi:hypothetical protein